MEMRFAPLYSGSSGNAVYVGCDEGHLLVDAGLSGSRIIEGLNSIGVKPGELKGILVTPEHVDHIKGIGVLSRKFDLPIYATEPTWQAMFSKIGAVADRNIRVIVPEENFFLGPVEIMAFSTPHDAAGSVGYAFELEGAKFALATDIGCVRDGWLKHVVGADSVLLESNYDPGMLEAGPYPYELKRRIFGKRGHLSNDDAGDVAVKLAEAGARQLVLGHLSKENNYPELALKCTEMALENAGFDVGEDIDVRVALRDSTTGIFSVRSRFDW